MSDFEQLEQALLHLAGGTDDERTAAIALVAEVRYAPAVPHLTVLVREADPGTRYLAAQALSKIGDEAESAVPTLLQALRADDMWLRASVTGALIQIGNPAVPGLIKALFDDNKAVRRAAAKALGKIGNDRAVSALTVALKDSDRAVKQFSAEALRRINTPEARAALDD
ncbi:MAG: HEAT repeat domain-containing protein [Anaerolineaceae bacterium]|nr:HEAT repeat domain-containing protein [Anaerolineaceae bacterium]